MKARVKNVLRQTLLQDRFLQENLGVTLEVDMSLPKAEVRSQNWMDIAKKERVRE